MFSVDLRLRRLQLLLAPRIRPPARFPTLKQTRQPVAQIAVYIFHTDYACLWMSLDSRR